MESNQLKRISIIGLSILCLSPMEIFSNKLFENRTEDSNVEIANVVKLDPNYLSNSYEIFNPNIKTVSSYVEKLTSENNREEITESEDNLESEATEETEEINNVENEEVVVENVQETSTSTNDQVQEYVQEQEVIVQQETTTVIDKVEESVETVSAPNTDVATSLVEFAKQFVGYPYKSGGTDLYSGVDCSGFTMKVFEQFGYSLPHSSASQSSYGYYVSIDNLALGDLIFYGYNGYISHVAIYIGNGQIVHAATSNSGIRIANYQMMPIITARRILN